MCHLKKIALLIVLFVLSGCSSKEIVLDKIKREEIVLKEEVFEVERVDWLFGNWIELCNKESGCRTIDLMSTGLRGTIKDNATVKVTETIINEGNKEWKETKYEQVD